MLTDGFELSIARRIFSLSSLNTKAICESTGGLSIHRRIWGQSPQTSQIDADYEPLSI